MESNQGHHFNIFQGENLKSFLLVSKIQGEENKLFSQDEMIFFLESSLILPLPLNDVRESNEWSCDCY